MFDSFFLIISFLLTINIKKILLTNYLDNMVYHDKTDKLNKIYRHHRNLVGILHNGIHFRYQCIELQRNMDEKNNVGYFQVHSFLQVNARKILSIRKQCQMFIIWNKLLLMKIITKIIMKITMKIIITYIYASTY